MYTLTIKRYNIFLKFETFEELKEEVCRYFTIGEIARGVMNRLLDFSRVPFVDGFKKNSYQDMYVCYYPDEGNKACRFVERGGRN